MRYIGAVWLIVGSMTNKAHVGVQVGRIRKKIPPIAKAVWISCEVNSQCFERLWAEDREGVVEMNSVDDDGGRPTSEEWSERGTPRRLLERASLYNSNLLHLLGLFLLINLSFHLQCINGATSRSLMTAQRLKGTRNVQPRTRVHGSRSRRSTRVLLFDHRTRRWG